MSEAPKSRNQPVTAEELLHGSEMCWSVCSLRVPQELTLAAQRWLPCPPLSRTRMAGSMSDASKRLRDQDMLSHLADEQFSQEAGFSDAGFSVVSSPVGKYQKFPQLPMAPKKSVPDEKIELPSGISSLAEWGRTVCELQRVKSDSKTYYELATDPGVWQLHQVDCAAWEGQRSSL